MDRSVAALIAIVLAAGCGPDDASSCLDQAEWQVALSHAGRTESTLTLTSDGIIVAIGDAAADVQLGTQTIHGAYLAHLATDGTLLGLVRAPEGDGMTGPARVLTDDSDNIYVAWTSAADSRLARYSPDLKRVWYYEMTGVNVMTYDVDAYGYSAVLTHEGLAHEQVTYMEPNGDIRWALSVEQERPTQLVIASNEDVFTWSVSTSNAVRYRLDQFSGAELTPTYYDSVPSVLYRDGGYVSSDGLRLVRVGSAGDELWSRDFEANIGLPIATTSGDVLLPAATGAAEELPYVIVLIDGSQGFTKAARARCARTILWAADSSAYYGIGDGGDHPGSIARFPLR